MLEDAVLFTFIMLSHKSFIINALLANDYQSVITCFIKETTYFSLYVRLSFSGNKQVDSSNAKTVIEGGHQMIVSCSLPTEVESFRVELDKSKFYKR